MTTANLIEIFCILDEFCKFFAPELKKHTIQVPGKRHRNRPSRMSDSEIMTILILFHTHRFRDLKSFYLGYVCQHMRKDFPNPVSYNRFVERQAQVGLHLLLFLQTYASSASLPTNICGASRSLTTQASPSGGPSIITLNGTMTETLPRCCPQSPSGGSPLTAPTASLPPFAIATAIYNIVVWTNCASHL